MPTQLSRRQFIQASAGASLIMLPGYARGQSPNEKLGIGVIGTANQARFSIDNVKGERIVAVCDIDDRYLAQAVKDFPTASPYSDWRKMLERKDIDAVVVATPDHMHALATLAALQTGRHVYCEKPLTHTVEEARKVAEAAKRYKRATQMGTQIHAEPNYRRVVEVIKSGAIGPVREVHVWVGKVWSGSGYPKETPPVPPHLHWDLWLGPAPERPYHPAYLPGNWRGWWDFGGGTLTDMACHYVDLPFWALDLRHPTAVEAKGSIYNSETTANWTTIGYDFPARGSMPALKLTWYDGGKRPPLFAEGKLPGWGDGVLFVGDKGMMLADYGRYVLLPEKDFAGYQPPAKSIPDSIGHHAEWIKACKTGSPTTCNFDYSGALTEAVLLGAASYKLGQRLEWDPKNLRATNCPDADMYLRKKYRAGWAI